MMINQTVSIGILKNDLIYILLETNEKKKSILFQQIYEDISKNLVPIRPERHLNNPVPVSLLSGDRKPQIRFLGNHPSGSGNLYHKSFRM